MVLCNCEYCVKGRQVIDAAQAKAKDADVERFWKGLLENMIYLGTTIVRVDPKEFYAEPQETVAPKRTYPWIGYYTMKAPGDAEPGTVVAVSFTAPETGKVVWTSGTTYKLGDTSDRWAEEYFKTGEQRAEEERRQLEALLEEWDEPDTFDDILAEELARPGAYKPFQLFPSFVEQLAQQERDAVNNSMKSSYEAREPALFEQYPFLRDVSDNEQRLLRANASLRAKIERLTRELNNDGA